MKFVDAINITVFAGNGGRGCVDLRKKGRGSFVTIGKGNSSNGGDGGDVWLLADTNINSLNFFNSCRIFRAGHGQCGRSKGCTGKKGKDLFIKVPWGTRVFCKGTNELLGDMGNNQKCLMVAKGGRGGIGNSNYNVNSYRETYQKTYGKSGDIQYLFLELILIADVGIFGLPNSGKSTFLRAISEAKPKVDNYPFTTLSPHLGVIRDIFFDSFVIADIPGIIAGASKGLGLGIRFLKHLEHCKMLLHFVDIAPMDCSDPIQNIVTIEHELRNYNHQLHRKPCWLVFNKIDLLRKNDLNKKINYIIKSLQWTGQYYFISAIHNTNVLSLCHNIMRFVGPRIKSD